MNSLKKFTTAFLTITMVFSLAACGGGDDAPAKDDGTEMEEIADDTSTMADESGLSDEEVLDTVRELVVLLEEMETMDADAALGAMEELFVLAAKLQDVDGARVEALLESEPELKAAIESLDSTLGQ